MSAYGSLLRLSVVKLIPLVACVMAVLLTACHRGSADQTAYMRNIRIPTPTQSPSWPSFLAEDYRKFRKPVLTPNEVSLIRKTLSLVTPCQRRILRYAFPSDGGTESPFALFFQGSAPFEATHALWTNNLFYDPHDGRIFPGAGDHPKWDGIQFEVSHTGCDGEPR
jgi:hypothetical protein